MKKKILLPSICIVALLGSISVLHLSAQDADEDLQAQTLEVQNEAETIEQSEPESLSQISTTSDGALVIGADDAPVTLVEYSSLSCSHCASFHTATLPDLKADYVDEGLLKIIFKDFPTNAPAMEASKLLRCVPLDQRYDFMNLLFEQQMQWAAVSDYRQKLKQYAALLGVSSEKADECMDNTAAEDNIVAGMQVANSKYEVTSTPSFVMNPGEDILIGARPYGEFSSRIEAIINASE
jgi:protein-disulfide isomerase